MYEELDQEQKQWYGYHTALWGAAMGYYDWLTKALKSCVLSTT